MNPEPPPSSVKSPPPLPLPNRIAQLAGGAKILAEWIGEGAVPVQQACANTRATICAGCPLNTKGDWYAAVITKAAEAIKKQVKLKNDLLLVVSNESELGTCAACGCHLPLKVWVPLAHIVHHTDDDTLDRLHQGCWIKREIKAAARIT